VLKPLLRRRLIFVTGKGGVGKTTVALALGLAAAQTGLRTIVADLNGDGDLEERRFAENLYRISVDPQSAMEEYLLVKVPGGAGNVLRQSKLFSAFAMATPGMRELLCMGKLWELAQLERRTDEAAPYDLVIVDAPASGHGVGILRTPRTFAEIARVGPIASQAQSIARTIADPAFTAIVAVSTAEEMPVNETLQLRDALASGSDPLELEAVILNGLYPDRFTPAEAAQLADHTDAPAVRIALNEHKRAQAQRLQQRRLDDEFGQRLVTLPYLFAPQLELPQLERLAQELAR
jgi:anion-transporting  ArsA/GET3 family ATPase